MEALVTYQELSIHPNRASFTASTPASESAFYQSIYNFYPLKLAAPGAKGASSYPIGLRDKVP